MQGIGYREVVTFSCRNCGGGRFLAGGGGFGGDKVMGFFTSRERSELDKTAEPRVQGVEREVVRHDFAPRARRRPAAEPDLTGHVGTLMRRVADSSLQDIDELIARLQRRREQLLIESERVQREVIEYAKLSQTTMQSTKIISESLAHFNKVPDAPRMSELHLADGDDAERRNGRAAALSLDEEDHRPQQDEDHGTSDDDAEDADHAELPDNVRSETA
jgi:hypothetical protein